MVLIHTRQTDDTTLEIIQWLQSENKEFFRVNTVQDIEIADSLFEQGRIDSIYFNGKGTIYPSIQVEDSALSAQIADYLDQDVNALWLSLFSKRSKNSKLFGQIPYPGNVLNKINVLEMARAIGFEVPVYQIIYRKEKLLAFKETHGRIICKSLADGISIVTKEVMIIGQRTEEITDEMLANFNDFFFPTFVQQLVEKAFEVRTFCFNRLTHSIAVFSQANEKSKIDSRSLDIENPQRRIPFNLPNEISAKIFKLLEELNLNYGSVDFIVTPENKFYFLEVNPYGQYGFVSKAGNFYIEKQIADYL